MYSVKGNWKVINGCSKYTYKGLPCIQFMNADVINQCPNKHTRVHGNSSFVNAHDELEQKVVSLIIRYRNSLCIVNDK